MKHLDSLGVEQDSIERGVVKIHLACNLNPMLRALMFEMYPTNETLNQ